MNLKFFKQEFFYTAHLPSFLLGIGFLIYWLELFVFKVGRGLCSPLATILFLFVMVFVLWKEKKDFRAAHQRFLTGFREFQLWTKVITVLGLFIICLQGVCGIWAWLQPPHLIQESDYLTYHLTLPRQHLLISSLRYIDWNSFDLLLNPIDYALAPYWLVTAWPNKFPQFFFLIGIVFVSGRLVKSFTPNQVFLRVLFVVFAILGSHNVGIQMGTAMLDLAICYLLLAAIDSFLSRKIFLCALELAFFVWSKSFVPLQVGVIIVFLGIFYCCLSMMKMNRRSWTVHENLSPDKPIDDKEFLKKIFVFWLLLSVFIAGPFIFKSYYYSGTPLFPFGAGIVNLNPALKEGSPPYQQVLEESKQYLNTRNQYGSGRSLVEFVRHLWLIAVPEKDVNNRYDYPVGLMYLIFLGPFVLQLRSVFEKKRFALLYFLVISYWLTWWLGSHQSRFLFIPIILIFILVCSELERFSKIFQSLILLALVLTAVSVIRSHQSDFGLSRYAMLRPKDKQILEISRNKRDRTPVFLNFRDVGFADFPVEVIK